MPPTLTPNVTAHPSPLHNATHHRNPLYSLACDFIMMFNIATGRESLFESRNEAAAAASKKTK